MAIELRVTSSTLYQEMEKLSNEYETYSREANNALQVGVEATERPKEAVQDRLDQLKGQVAEYLTPRFQAIGKQMESMAVFPESAIRLHLRGSWIHLKGQNQQLDDVLNKGIPHWFESLEKIHEIARGCLNKNAFLQAQLEHACSMKERVVEFLAQPELNDPKVKPLIGYALKIYSDLSTSVDLEQLWSAHQRIEALKEQPLSPEQLSSSIEEILDSLGIGLSAQIWGKINRPDDLQNVEKIQKVIESAVKERGEPPFSVADIPTQAQMEFNPYNPRSQELLRNAGILNRSSDWV